MTIKTSRRDFLKGTAAVGVAVTASVLIVGVSPNGAVAAGEAAAFNPFIKIGEDGKVIAIIKHVEKGQGPATGLSTLIAEELGVRMDQITFDFAPSNPAVYNNLLWGPIQGTGGSSAIANSFMQYRKAGAAARDMLIRAAAEAWGVSTDGMKIEDGMIIGSSKSEPIGSFVAAASQLEAQPEPKLKNPSEFRLIGNPDIRRLDSAMKGDGTAQYAMDVHLPNQMVVMIARPGPRGASVVSFDDEGAREIKGFIMAKTLPNKAGVAVYAENTWGAMQARDALDVEWDLSTAEARSSDEIRNEIISALNEEPTYNVNKTDRAVTEDALNGAATILEKTFYFPLLAHAPMEPLNCTIEATADGGIRVHDGAQMPTGPHGHLAELFNLPMDKVEIKSMLAGGSFGRRATPDSDYQMEAGMAFIMTDRSRPVKLVWSREDDIRSGYYRPAFGHKVRVGLDEDGKIIGWDHRIAGQPILKGTLFEAVLVHDGVDHASVEGASDTVYQIPNAFFGLTDVKKATSTLWWRAVGNTHTAYVMETMMDMAAKSAGQDPVTYRLGYLSGDGPDQKRLAGVLKLAAEKAGWGSAKEGRSQGIAVHKSFGSFVAQVVEISGNADEGVRIENVTCAVDCGIVVNPDVVKAQMEGGIGYGIGHAMRDQITLDAGVVEQYNFPDYEPLRINDIASIDVHIVPSAEPPTGVGEPGTPPAAPALANAIAAASDDLRVANHPMVDNGVSFV